MGATLDIIDVWLKRCVAYTNAMKDIFKQMPQNIIKSLTPKQKVQKLMTDISGEWYMKKIDKELPQLKKSKLSKKHKESG